MKLIFLKNKAGVTVLEGVIALGLLAMIMTGAFGVLLSSSRQATEPEMREEMMRAIESASDMLKEYAPYAPDWMDNELGNKLKDHQRTFTFRGETVDYSKGLCGGDNTPLSVGTHKIDCLLPPICGSSSSCGTAGCFTYTVNTAADFSHASAWPKWVDGAWEGHDNEQMYKLDTGGYLLERDYTSFSNNPSFSSIVPGYTIQFKIICNGYQL